MVKLRLHQPPARNATARGDEVTAGKKMVASSLVDSCSSDRAVSVPQPRQLTLYLIEEMVENQPSRPLTSMALHTDDHVTSQGGKRANRKPDLAGKTLGSLSPAKGNRQRHRGPSLLTPSRSLLLLSLSLPVPFLSPSLSLSASLYLPLVWFPSPAVIERSTPELLH